jgi:hypothetical protein
MPPCEGEKCLGGLCKFLSSVHSATVRGSFAPYPGKPAVNDIGSTAAAVIGIYIDGVNRAVFSTGAAFHASVSVDDLGLVVPNSEDAVRADQFAVAATDTFFLR